MRNKSMIKKMVATVVATAVVIAAVPAEESMAKKGNGSKQRQVYEDARTVTEGAIKATKAPKCVTEGAIKANPKKKNGKKVVTGGAIDVKPVSGGSISGKKDKVKAKQPKIKLAKKAKNLKKGKKFTIEYSIENGTAKISFASSDSSVAKVSSKGVVTAKKKGTAVITVKLSTGDTKTFTVKVK